jgi:hypothetical protein
VNADSPAKSWLLLVYRIRREPTAGRVFVWRKLKQLGAVLLQDAVWVLPHTSRTLEQLQWLAAEISELGGEALLWEADALYATDLDALRRRFTAPVDAEYRDILLALRKKGRDLAALSRRFQEAQARDYFATDLGRRAREKLLPASGG